MNNSMNPSVLGGSQQPEEQHITTICEEVLKIKKSREQTLVEL